VSEDRTDDAIEELRREFVRELELDLAAVVPERAKPPFAVKVAKRPVLSVMTIESGGCIALSVVKCARTPW
jgi:hypothetical protein